MRTKYFKGLGRIPVQDAKKSVTIERSKMAILLGKRGEGEACPDFQACKEHAKAFLPHKVVAAHLDTSVMWAIAVRKANLYGVRYNRPAADSEAIVLFDKTGKMDARPIRFLAPVGVRKMGARYSRTVEQVNRVRSEPKAKRKGVLRGAKLRAMNASLALAIGA